MARHHKFRDLVAHLNGDPVRRARIEAETRAMRDVQAVMQVRAEHAMTQRPSAEISATPRGTVATIESRIDQDTDVYLATLHHFIAEIGGRIEIAAVFPDETIALVPAPCGERAPTGDET